MMDLRLGDCLDVMKDIPDNSIDMVLTDPPYGTTACKWDTVIPFSWHVTIKGKHYSLDNYLKLKKSSLAFFELNKKMGMWEHLKRITRDNGAICLFGSEPFSSSLRMSNIKMFKYDWIWHKSQATGFLNCKRMPLREFEIVSVFYKKQANYYPILNDKDPKNIRNKCQNIKAKESENYGKYKRSDEFRSIPINKTYPRDVLKINNSNIKKKLHPTQKPVALLEYLIKTFTLEGETVVDFAMGSASTGVACKNLSRKFIGIEKEEKYFKIAKERVNFD